MTGSALNKKAVSENIISILSAHFTVDRELEEIKKKGLEGRQLQYILRQLFNSDVTVYVPTIEDLSDVRPLPLNELKKQGVRHVIFAFKANASHQIAVDIDLHFQPYSVALYDSLATTLETVLAPTDRLHLTELLGIESSDYNFRLEQSPFAAQEENDSLCGVYAIEHLRYALSDRKKVTDSRLSVDVLADTYYEMFKKQQADLEQAEVNLSIRSFLESFQSLADKATAFLPEHAPKCLLMHIPVNMDNENVDPQYVNLLKTELELALVGLSEQERAGFLYALLNIFFHDDIKNELILRKFLEHLKLNSDEYLDKIKTGSAKIILDVLFKEGYIGQSADFKKLAAEAALQAILEKLALDVNVYTEQFKSSSSTQLVFVLLQEIIARTVDVKVDLTSQRKRKRIEDAVWQETKKNVLSKVKSILNALHIEGLPEAQVSALAENDSAYLFLARYANPDFFAGCDSHAILNFILNLIDAKIERSLWAALNLYPGKNYLSIIKQHEDKIFKIQDVIEIVQLLYQKSSAEALPFLIEYQGIIKNAKKLGKILAAVPEERRFDIATQFQGKIQDAQELSAVIQALPAEQQLAFFEGHTDKIKTGMDLACVVWGLNVAQKLEIATQFEGKIRDAIELSQVIYQLPAAQQLDFLKTHEDKIQTGIDLAFVVLGFDPAQKLRIATQFQGKIQDAVELGQVIYQLFTTQQLDFLKTHEDKIQNGTDVVAVVWWLDSSQKLKIATQFEGKIQNATELGKVIQELHGEQKLAFFERHVDKIKTGTDLAAVVWGFDPAQKLKIATQFKGKIQDALELGQVINQLPAAQKLDFLKMHEDKIQNGIDLAVVVWGLHLTQKLRIATQLEGKVQDAVELGQVIYQLPVAQKLDFLKMHEDKIKTGTSLALVLWVLDPAQKLEIAIRFKSKIQDETEWSQVLSMLLPDEQIVLRESCQNRISQKPAEILPFFNETKGSVQCLNKDFSSENQQ